MLTPFPIGSISHGTMRLQDTLPAMLDTLSELAKHDSMLSAIEAQYALMPFGIIPNHAQDDDDADWWQSDEADNLYADLHDTLNGACPSLVYFSSHAGDGSDLGFWPIDDLGEAAANRGIPIKPAGSTYSDTGEVLEINDHGNCTLYYICPTSGKRNEVWSCV